MTFADIDPSKEREEQALQLWQTRSEVNGILRWGSKEHAFAEAQIDPTVWKVSGPDVRYVKTDDGCTWADEPILGIKEGKNPEDLNRELTEILKRGGIYNFTPRRLFYPDKSWIDENPDVKADSKMISEYLDTINVLPVYETFSEAQSENGTPL